MTAQMRLPGSVRLACALATLAAFAAVPSLTSAFTQTIAMNVLIFALLAMSLDVLAGYAGMMSFGHAAFLGLGAYGLGYGQSKGMGAFTSVGFALALVLTVALVFGFLAVRSAGLSFGMVTLSLGGILWGLALRWTSVTGGENGLPIPTRPTLFGIDLADERTFYYAVLVVVAASVLVLRVVIGSAFGLSLRGIRDNDARMRTLGYDVGLVRYLVYVLTALFAGVSGILYGFYQHFVTPVALDIPHSFVALMMVVLGGIGTLWGGLIGALVVVGIQQWLTIYVERWQLVLGSVFVFAILFARAGVFGTALLLGRRLALVGRSVR